MAPSRFIKASEVREYVFCPRSWAFRRREIKPPPEALAERETRIDYGNRFHREHGEAVCQAGRQLRRGASFVRVGLTIIVWGFIAWLVLSSH
jgi:hypothetical protein